MTRYGFVTDRRLIALDGAEARDFLQDLVTNDIRKAAVDRAVYAALLTPQGKFLCDFHVLGTETGLVLEVAGAAAAGLTQRLTLYRLRRKIAIAEAPGQVAVLWGDGPLDPLPQAPETARLFADPRDPRLGARLHAPDAAAALAALGAAPASAADRAALRVALGVPAMGPDLTPETYILEAGFERLNGVDFRKGCFVGQEVVARMKHKTELRKGLVRLELDGPAPAPGTEILTEDGRSAGTLGTVAGDRALAHLRFDRADGPLTAGQARLRRLP